jgi:transcriptional regulator GlxA family with amidase domain
VVAFPDAQVLDVVGPLEVFGGTSRALIAAGRRTQPSYEIEVLAAQAGPLTTSGGLVLHATRAFSSVSSGIDTLLVAGGAGARAASRDEALLAWLRRMAPRVRRFGSVCTGARVLAAAGLLDGKRVTTHWGAAAELAEDYPRVRVEPDAIFVRDDSLWTSAGVTAGMDLALALLEADLGRDVALTAARQLVLFLKRPGGQSQFSAQLAAQEAEREPVRRLQTWIVEHPSADLSVAQLARRAALSPRHFARIFREEIGTTPARFVTQIRVEAARRRIEDSREGLEEIAAACGFASAEVMRRAFLRTVRVSPAAYRSRFQPARDAREPRPTPSRRKEKIR